MKKSSLISGIVLLALAAFVVAFAPAAWSSTPKADAPRVTISVAENDTASNVAMKLRSNGIVVTTIGYNIYSVLDAAARRPKLGDYQLQPGMSYKTIARLLATGPAREEIQLQVIEGWTLRDVATMLSQGGTTSTEPFYRSVGNVSSSTGFDSEWRTDYPFLASLPTDATLEGYLFPDTYRVWKDQLPESLIKKQLDAFAVHAPDWQAAAKAQNVPLKDVVTLASIIEKEVQTPEDRRIVAGIFINRLNDDMALQSDATLNYITNSGRANSTAADLAIDSPYNTYKYRGLPPGPICNPSADAIEAALHPTQTNYRYFLTDKEGKVYYAKTLEEHNQNKVKAGY